MNKKRSFVRLEKISLIGKTRLAIIGGNLNAEFHISTVWDQTLSSKMTFPHRVGFIRDKVQNLGTERMKWSTSSPDPNLTEHLWDQFGCAVHARVTKTTTLADLQ